MRIAVNTRFLLPDKLEGLGLYTHEVCRRMVAANPEVEFHFLFDRKFDDRYLYGDNVSGHSVSPPARHPLLWQVWYEWSMPRILKKIKADVFFSPDGFTSKAYRGKKALVIHDLGFEHYPEHLPSKVSQFYRKNTPAYCLGADHIFAVSESTKQDVIKSYGVSAEKISVAYNGCRHGFAPMDETTIQSVRNEYTNGSPYFLFVGALHPRKNVSHLLASFDAFCDSYPSFQLVITGRKAWMNSDMEAVFKKMKHADKIVFTGYKDVDALQKLTASAFACLYPSLFEGFGVPMLEAMTSGVPVIASNVSVMPEIVGDAGILVDPTSIESTVEGMKELVEDETVRLQAIERGLERSKQFSWDDSASHIFDTLSRLAGN